MTPGIYYSRQELEKDLLPLEDSLQSLKILSAYEMAESIYQNRFRANGNPHFYHISRICRIIIRELQNLESDIIIASMLQDVLVISNDINTEVLEFNYGTYPVFIIETLTEEYKRQKQMDWQIPHIQDIGGPDGLIIRLAKGLDNLRYLDFDILQNPISYLNSVTYKYFKIADSSDNPYVQYLVNEIRKESNKIIG